MVALLDAVRAGAAVDVVPALAEPFPVRVIADLLGVPADKQDRFVEWSDAGIPDAGDMAPEQRMPR